MQGRIFDTSRADKAKKEGEKAKKQYEIIASKNFIGAFHHGGRAYDYDTASNIVKDYSPGVRWQLTIKPIENDLDKKIEVSKKRSRDDDLSPGI